METFIADNGKHIYYKIVDNYSDKMKVINGVEKIGRYIYFYDEKRTLIKWERIYGDYDDMQNISPIIAKKYYENP